MSNKYNSIGALSDAIDTEREDCNNLTMYLDGGEVLVNNENGETIFRGYEQQVLIDLFMLFLGVEHEAI